MGSGTVVVRGSDVGKKDMGPGVWPAAQGRAPPRAADVRPCAGAQGHTHTFRPLRLSRRCVLERRGREQCGPRHRRRFCGAGGGGTGRRTCSGRGRRGGGRWAAHAPPPCGMPSGCCFFTGPWTGTRSSLRMLRRVAAFCRPLRPVLLLVSFPRSRSPVVGVPGVAVDVAGVV